MSSTGRRDSSSASINGSEGSPAPLMRKSCHFCRSRKIRCSGQSICAACQERNLDCVYGREGTKGRPKVNPTKTSSTRGIPSKTKNKAPAAKFKETFGTLPQLTAVSQRPEGPQMLAGPQSILQPWEVSPVKGSDMVTSQSIGEDLTHIFDRLFTPSTNGHAEDAIDALGRRMSELRSSATQGPCTMMTPAIEYEQPLAILIEELVEMVAMQFGDLGCCASSMRSDARLFKQCLEVDNTLNMFDAVDPPPETLLDYSSFQTLQMIDVWFSHHPLAFLLSKTLLVRNYRDGTQNRILLAVVLADVASAQHDVDVRFRGTQLFQWAASELESVSRAEVDLSVVQALILLGWYDLCARRPRRSIAYFIHASYLIPNLRKPDVCLNQINGMDVGDIETELSRNARWIVFSIVLWVFMQCDAPLMDLLPSGDASIAFPPINESSSRVYALDLLSDNTSTLPHQAKSIRDLWPISHVASTTAHIYALYPRQQVKTATWTPLVTPSWQSQTLRRLQHLSEPPRVVPQDFSLMCHKVRHILIGAVQYLETSTDDQIAQSLVLSAYHTMIIHLLFPSRIIMASHEKLIITDSLMEDFCTSVKALLRVNPTTKSPVEGGRMNLHEVSRDVNAEVFMLGLDASSRVFARFQLCSQNCSPNLAQDSLAMMASDLRVLLNRGDELTVLASDLHALSKTNMLRSTKRSKAVKRQLKEVNHHFAYLEASSSFRISRQTSHDHTSSTRSIDQEGPPSLIHSSSTDSTATDSSTHTNDASGNNTIYQSHHSLGDGRADVGSRFPLFTTPEYGLAGKHPPTNLTTAKSMSLCEDFPPLSATTQPTIQDASNDSMTGFFDTYDFLSTDPKANENDLGIFGNFALPNHPTDMLYDLDGSS